VEKVKLILENVTMAQMGSSGTFPFNLGTRWGGWSQPHPSLGPQLAGYTAPHPRTILPSVSTTTCINTSEKYLKSLFPIFNVKYYQYPFLKCVTKNKLLTSMADSQFFI